jgi:hypothetical protein
MSISVIDHDREQLSAKRTSGQLRMTSNSPAIRVRQDADGLALIDETKPHARALKSILEFAHASEDPRETPNDG